MTLLAFNKPFGVLCQFRDEDGRPCLSDYIDVPAVYPAGRLDKDSEGLLLLTDDGALQARISEPRHKLVKRYWVQVEGEITASSTTALEQGVGLRDGLARAVSARVCKAPENLWPRQPPIRVRRQIPTSWLNLHLDQGRNRQVRRMTAAIGYPTLRLIRHQIGPWTLGALAPGEWVRLAADELPGRD